MHPCLQIAEIQEFIVDHLTHSVTAQCLPLASTCKAFYTPAMNRLWRRMSYGLVPLVKCMPDELLTATTETTEDEFGTSVKTEVVVSLP